MPVEAGWTSRALERWIVSRRAVADEDVLVLWSQPSKGDLVEVLALDRAGRLVVIAIVAEGSTREVAGQVLESLWNYGAITLSELADDYQLRSRVETTLGAAFAARFGAPLVSIEERPRVVVVAPGFSAHTTVAMRYLRDRLGLHVRLLVATPSDEAFTFTEYELPSLTHTQRLRAGDCGTGRGRLFCVLQGGNPAVLWHIGRESGGAVALLGRDALARHAVRLEARILAPVEPPAAVDLADSGTFWIDRSDPDHGAWLVGAVATRDPEPLDQVVTAEWRAEALEGFGLYPRRDFEKRWTRTVAPFPVDWRRIVGGGGASGG
jgi:hypothetical protein